MTEHESKHRESDSSASLEAQESTASTSQEESSDTDEQAKKDKAREVSFSDLLGESLQDDDEDFLGLKKAGATATRERSKRSTSPKMRRSNLKETSPERRLLKEEEAELLGSVEGEELWSDPASTDAMLEIVELLYKTPSRPAFSQQERDCARELASHLNASREKEEIELRPRAAGAFPLMPAFTYATLGIASLLLGIFSTLLSFLCSLGVFVLLLVDLLVGKRLLQLILPPRATSQISTTTTHTQKPLVILHASFGTRQVDPLHTPELSTLSRRWPASFSLVWCLLGGLLPLPLLSAWRLWSANVWIFPLQFLTFLGLVVLIFLVLRGKRTLPDDGQQAAAVAVAVEATQRLQKLESMATAQLLLTGAADHAYGLESFLREHEASLPPETLLIHIDALGARGTKLHYIRREGPLWKSPLSKRLSQSADWAAARYAHPEPKARFGDGAAWRASRYRTHAMTLCSEIDGHFMLQKDGPQGLDPQILDQAAGFVVALVQNFLTEEG